MNASGFRTDNVKDVYNLQEIIGEYPPLTAEALSAK